MRTTGGIPLVANGVFGIPNSQEMPLRRILYLCPNARDLVTINIKADNANPEWTTREDLVQEPLWPRYAYIGEPCEVRPETALTEAERKHVEARWALIRNILTNNIPHVFFQDKRRKIIFITALRFNVSPSTVLRLLRRWWQRGQNRSALIPDFGARGAPGKRREPGNCDRGRPPIGNGLLRPPQFRVDADSRRLITRGAEKFLKQGMSLSDAYKSTINAYFSEYAYFDGRPEIRTSQYIPTEAQFRYYAKATVSTIDRQKAQTKKSKYDSNHSGHLGSSGAKVTHPGHVYEIDATLADVYLLSELHPGRLIGRPVIYTVVDLYSHMFVGIHICLSGPSWEQAGQALMNSFLEKKSFCAGFGVEIDDDEWPCYGTCDTALTDRGPEFTSKAIAAAGKHLNLIQAVLPPERPDMKPVVENRFRLLRDFLEQWAPGNTHRRDGKDCRLDAHYTLRRFTQLMILFLINHNKNQRFRVLRPGMRTFRDANPTPLELWNYGLQYGTPHRRRDIDILASLLPQKAVSASKKGLRYSDDLYYSCEFGEQHGWFDRSDTVQFGRWQLAVAPSNVSRAFVFIDGTAQPAYLVGHSRFFENRSMQEVLDWRAVWTAGNASVARMTLESRLNFDERIRACNREAESDRKRLMGDARPSTRGMREVRASERAGRPPHIPSDLFPPVARAGEPDDLARLQAARRLPKHDNGSGGEEP